MWKNIFILRLLLQCDEGGVHLRATPCTYCKSLLLVTPTMNVQCNISHDFRQLILNGDFLAGPSRKGRALYVNCY